MEKQQIVESILETVKAQIEEFVDQQETISTSIEYEDKVWEIVNNFGLDLIIKSQGLLPKSRNSKKKS